MNKTTTANAPFQVGDHVFWVVDHKLYDSQTELYPSKPIPPEIREGEIRELPTDDDLYTLEKRDGCACLISWHHEWNIARTPTEAAHNYIKKKLEEGKPIDKKYVHSLLKQAEKIVAKQAHKRETREAKELFLNYSISTAKISAETHIVRSLNDEYELTRLKYANGKTTYYRIKIYKTLAAAVRASRRWMHDTIQAAPL